MTTQNSFNNNLPTMTLIQKQVVANTGTSYAMNPVTGAFFDLTLTGNATITVTESIIATQAQFFYARITQDGTGSRTLAFSGVTWLEGRAPVMPTASGSYIYLNFIAINGSILGYQAGTTEIPVATITGTTTLDATHWGKYLLFNSASAFTVTLPQQSTLVTNVGVNFLCANQGAGTVTLAKQGAETLSGNSTFITNAVGQVQRDTTTDWRVWGGTAIVNMFGESVVFANLTTSQTDVLTGQVGTTCTLLGIYQQCRALTTAGSFAIQKNGVTLSGLGTIVPSTGGSYTSATGTGGDNVLVRGDKLTIVANGTLVAVLDLNITMDITQPF